ncbi:hypothetical protein CC1G_13089 [Coprinopsis cinerea okayama7|uniref:Uncharacterized protein n=1 Tax=Coprinopsis cinerea (strain Okayama-7 / 130 / ATCC MYA-4618 / FGSC 9003) TaxID=240176 RepID=A8NZ95_COPC7|nr:hypothetical protein CC1G_13089 [Coprinopsis cinerea okayama7\|eukprot:XP_001837634.2 hypothetical protein CC1G_13089 [Coprinopsis cinerea okayama7\
MAPSVKLIEKLDELYNLVNSVSQWSEHEVKTKKERLIRVSLKFLQYFNEDKSLTADDLSPVYTQWINTALSVSKDPHSIDLKLLDNPDFKKKPPLLVKYPLSSTVPPNTNVKTEKTQKKQDSGRTKKHVVFQDDQDASKSSVTRSKTSPSDSSGKAKSSMASTAQGRKRPLPEDDAPPQEQPSTHDTHEPSSKKPKAATPPPVARPRPRPIPKPLKPDQPSDKTSNMFDKNPYPPKRSPLPQQRPPTNSYPSNDEVEKDQSAQEPVLRLRSHSPDSDKANDDESKHFGRRLPLPRSSDLPQGNLPHDVAQLHHLYSQLSAKLNETEGQTRALMEYYHAERRQLLDDNASLRKQLLDNQLTFRSHENQIKVLQGYTDELEERISDLEHHGNEKPSQVIHGRLDKVERKCAELDKELKAQKAAFEFDVSNFIDMQGHPGQAGPHLYNHPEVYPPIPQTHPIIQNNTQPPNTHSDSPIPLVLPDTRPAIAPNPQTTHSQPQGSQVHQLAPHGPNTHTHPQAPPDTHPPGPQIALPQSGNSQAHHAIPQGPMASFNNPNAPTFPNPGPNHSHSSGEPVSSHHQQGSRSATPINRGEGGSTKE